MAFNLLGFILDNVYIEFLAIIALGFIAAGIIHLFLNVVVKRWTAKTETDLDDLILHAIIRPIYLLMIVISLNIAIKVVETALQELRWLDPIFFIIYTLIFSYAVAKVVGILITKWLQVSKKFEKTPKLLSKITSSIIYILAILIILKKLNVEITPFIATLGIGGLAVGLALQNTLSNLFAGLHIISDEPVKVGDSIDIQGVADATGRIEDIGWRSTRIKTPADNIVIIPNAKLADSIIINYTQGQKDVSVPVKLGVSYDSDLDEVENITVDVAKRIQKTTPGALKTHEPTVRFNNFGESNIEFTIALRAETFADRAPLAHAFIKALKKEYDKKNIEIAYPTRKIYSAHTRK